jgi:hypothetical protein
MRKPAHLLAASLIIFAAVYALNQFWPLTISLLIVTLAILGLCLGKFFAIALEAKQKNPDESIFKGLKF